LALSNERPSLIALEEPLAASGVISKVRLLRELREIARRAIVLCVTASPRQAAELASEVVLLDSGQFKRVVMGPTGPGLTLGSDATLNLVSSDVSELAQALCLVPGVAIIGMDAARDQLRLRSQDPRAMAREVLRVVAERKLDLRAMTQELPELGEIRAANAALSRVAYERAYGAVTGPPMMAAQPAASPGGPRP
jgi:ABC-type multidrug transport system ATPase subunit